jgi:redox-sensitive bicupin YhaK (pirin superfamily)
MWWNFVARTQDEIAQAHADWETVDGSERWQRTKALG